MGQFIVLEVDADSTATALRVKFDGKVGMRVVGVFQRPAGHCEHDLRAGGYDSAKQVKRGARYGWWLHAVKGCMRPRRGTHQLVNRLPIEDYPVVDSRQYTQMVQELSIADVPTRNMARR